MIQVKIVTHFNEDPFSHGLVQGLADRIRRISEEVRCADHGADPTVCLSTEGIAQTLNEISVEVTGCCPELVARVTALLDELRNDGTDVRQS
ncbi:MAG: hypothetical protein KY464_03165 [Gemmatimonadetes bacterium]|nr:hypothetical protein [Gemmatimonadota bacterium]